MITFNLEEDYCRWNGILMDDETCTLLFGTTFEDLHEGDTYYFRDMTIYAKNNFSKKEVLSDFFNDYVKDTQVYSPFIRRTAEKEPMMRVVIELEDLVEIVENGVKTEDEYFNLFTDYNQYINFVNDLNKFYQETYHI
jgi:hypothetical protein